MDSDWLEDPLIAGTTVSLLVELVNHDCLQQAHVLRTTLKGHMLRYCGHLTTGTTVFLLTQARVDSQENGSMPVLVATSQTQTFPKPHINMQHITSVVEVCSGMGCLGQGLEAAGFSIALRTDQNGMMTQLASRIADAPTSTCDVCDDQILADVSHRAPMAGTAAAGVPCQPCSRLGDKQAQDDSRSKPLLSFLRMCFLLRFCVIIIECVSEAFSCPWFQQVLRTFCSRTHFFLQQGVLHLQSTWPARRTRLWVTLTHPMIGPCSWAPMPVVTPTPVVSHIIDAFLTCTEEELRQLRLDNYELRRFDDHNFESNRLHWNRQMQTAMQLTGCPCGCRQFPFSEARISKGGLHGILVPIEGETTAGSYTYPNHRHVHPDELALLNGLLAGQPWGQPLKLVLCAIGQLASPMQALWVGTHVIKLLASKNMHPCPDHTPDETMLNYMSKLLCSRDAVFGPPTGTNSKLFQQMVDSRIFAMQESAPATSEPGQSTETVEAPTMEASEDLQSPLADQIPVPSFIPPLMPTTAPAQTHAFGVQGFETKRRKLHHHTEATNALVSHDETELSTQEKNALLAESPPKQVPVATEGTQVTTPSIAATDPDTVSQVDPAPELAQVELPGLPEETSEKHGILTVRHVDDDTVIKVRVSETTTAGQLTVAEDKLHSMSQPISTRTWCNAYLPLTDQVGDHAMCQISATCYEPLECPNRCDQPKLPDVTFPCTREDALMRQQGWVSCDEMDFYLAALQTDDLALKIDTRNFVNQAEASASVAEWLAEVLQADPDLYFVTAYVVGNHWIPLVIHTGMFSVDIWTTTDDAGVAKTLESLLSSSVSIRHVPLPHAFAADCGFQSLAWAVAVIQQQQPEALQPHKAQHWRNSFMDHLVTTGLNTMVIYYLPLGGMQNDQFYKPVSDLLASHGVFPTNLHERTKLVLQHVGSAQLAAILQSKRQWADLKAAANSVKPVLRLISQAELDAQIKARTQQGKSIGKKPNKAAFRNEPVRAPPVIRASELMVPEGVFRQQDGPLLGAITADQVGPKAGGVIVLDQDDADTILKLTRPVTPHALALIVIATPDNQNCHNQPAIRFPAMYTSTQEPVLVSGYMYQLGQQVACRQEPAHKLAVEEQEAEAIRVVVFQDQAGDLWDNMQSSPVKTVLQSEPLLAHSPDAASPVIDVWDRQWVTKRFEKVKQSYASMFSFMIRVLASEVTAVVATSGQKGIYYEPRSICGRFASTTHHVTWLPSMSFQEAKYAQQTAPHPVSLVRHGDRFGLRSDTMNASQVHSKFRADTPLLLGGTKSLYALGPLPFSTTKEAIGKLLKAWDWEARALQPRGRSADHSGVTWTIQAVEDPSHWIYSLKHGDVLITKIQNAPATPAPHAQFSIVASKKTMDHLKSDRDPFLDDDPWAAEAKKRKSQAATAAAVTQSHLAQMEASSLHHAWTPEDFATARCTVATSLVQRHWITMGTVYGFAERANTVEVQQHTNRLLQGLTDRIVDGSPGMRVITGDWNMELQHVAHATYWESQGWIEAQALAQKLWNRPPIATCRRKTIKGFVLLSPEVIPHVVDITIDWSMFPDHAVIMVELADLERPSAIPIWRKPTPIAWPTKPPDEAHTWQMEPAPREDSQQWYQYLGVALEQYANQVLPSKLHPRQTGRASTVEVTWTCPHEVPLKPNRAGDIQAALPGINLQHSRWTRQVRRLQHFARCPDQDLSPTQWEHRLNLWHAIKKAPGFAPGFLRWWQELTKQNPESPAILTDDPPTKQHAEWIFQEMAHVYRRLEHDLSTTRHQQAKARRMHDPLLIYRDIQRDKAEPVSTLVQKVTVPTTKITRDNRTFLQCAAAPPKAFARATVGEVPVHPRSFESVLEVEVNPDMPPNPIVFEQIVADAEEVIKAFNHEWGPRWQVHDQTSMEHWEAIVSFAQAALPTVPAHEAAHYFPGITPEVWRRAVRRKKKSAAIGPDGFSKSDLSHMPDSVLQSLLQLFSEIEQGRPWPPQMVLGIVSALAKTPLARTVREYRPITVFAMTYRVWGSIRSQQCLKFLLRIVPSTLLGNIPGRSPKQMWFHVQECIEYAMSTSTGISGGVIDIVKCFNALPRTPLMEVAKQVGIPTNVVLPWTNALRQMHRRFRVGPCTGPPVASSTGYPEGDGLSVVAMALTNVLCEAWMKHRMPTCQMWSFVDNLETLVATANQAKQSVELLTQFCQIMDLEVDPHKSYCWSNTKEDRKYLRTTNTLQKHYARDLGGHMNYTKLPTNATIQNKIEAIKPAWSKLARSCAPVNQKSRALRVAFWPNLFYGGSTVTVGNNHFVSLRASAMKGLGLTKPGANPMLQLSCMNTPTTDPEFYHLWDTLTSFRECHTPELSDAILDAVMHGQKPTPGPCKSFLVAIHKLAWEWLGNGWVLDQDRLPLHVWGCCRGELFTRAAHSWQRRCLSEVEQCRPTMPSLHRSDVLTTLKCWKAQSAEHHGLIRCMLNGTQYTNDYAVHTGYAESKQCSFCTHSMDSSMHRMWDCPAFAHIRSKYPSVMAEADTLPAVTKSRAWLPEPPQEVNFHRMLLAVPDTTGAFNWPGHCSQLPTPMDIFTDGSCLAPTRPTVRVATWGIVVWTGAIFWPLASGVVQGWRHTSLRAELTAMLAALNAVVCHASEARLWTDNQTVYKTLLRWLSNEFVPLRHRPDRDLWEAVFQQFRIAYPWIKGVYKVQSHCDPGEQECAFDQWAVEGNNAADSCAEQARQHVPGETWQTRQDVLDHIVRVETLGIEMMRMFGEISHAAIQTKPSPVTVPEGHNSGEATLTCDNGVLDLAAQPVMNLPMHYHVDETPHLMRWLQTLVTPTVPTAWVSFHQLLLDYQMFSGRLGPRSVDNQWRPVTYKPSAYNHLQHVSWFSRWLTNVAKQMETPLRVTQRRPASHTLAMWTGCVAVNIDLQRLRLIDDHIHQQARSLPVRQLKRDLGDIGPARQVAS
eukprot:Skav219674  [mRNA]  locus=scaffold3149:156736:166299:+ [translate_table: standard]